MIYSSTMREALLKNATRTNSACISTSQVRHTVGYGSRTHGHWPSFRTSLLYFRTFIRCYSESTFTSTKILCTHND
jgi:hypothetical protein